MNRICRKSERVRHFYGLSEGVLIVNVVCVLPILVFQNFADLTQHTMPNEVNKENLLNIPVPACLPYFNSHYLVSQHKYNLLWGEEISCYMAAVKPITF